jgi:DNA-binding MarR family transcriptional regulator
VLAVVSQKPTMAARDVVAQTPMDKMAVSRAVASLEGKGLLARRKAKDRRVAEIEMTQGGRAVFARVAAIARAYEARAFGALSAAERETLFALLDRLEQSVAGIDPDRAP